MRLPEAGRQENGSQDLLESKWHGPDVWRWDMVAALIQLRREFSGILEVGGGAVEDSPAPLPLRWKMQSERPGDSFWDW